MSDVRLGVDGGQAEVAADEADYLPVVPVPLRARGQTVHSGAAHLLLRGAGVLQVVHQLIRAPPPVLGPGHQLQQPQDRHRGVGIAQVVRPAHATCQVSRVTCQVSGVPT